MISTETALNELGIDAVTGVEMMDWLGVSSIDLGDPSRFSRLKDVIDYFKQFPIDTQRFLIRKATNAKNVDKLIHVWEYAELLKRRGHVEGELKKNTDEHSVLGESADLSLRTANAQRALELKMSLNAVNNEIAIYEK